jgi:hypothetical protein
VYKERGLAAHPPQLTAYSRTHITTTPPPHLYLYAFTMVAFKSILSAVAVLALSGGALADHWVRSLTPPPAPLLLIARR